MAFDVDEGENITNLIFNKIYNNCIVLRKNYAKIYEPWRDLLIYKSIVNLGIEHEIK